MPFDSPGPEAVPIREPAWPHRRHPGAVKAKVVPDGLPGHDRTADVRSGAIGVGRRPASNVIPEHRGGGLWQFVKQNAAARSKNPPSQRGFRYGKNVCTRGGKAYFPERVRTLGVSPLHCSEAPSWITGCQALRCERRTDQLRARPDVALVRGACNETISAGVRGLAASVSTLGFAPNGWGRRASNHLCIDRSTVLTLSSMHSHGYC